MTGPRPTNISFAEFELDRSLRKLLREGEPVVLYAKTFDLLDVLIEKNGLVVSKDEILEAVWPGQFVEEANLSVQISALRKALGEKANAPRFLVTVPGKGYKFIADIRETNGHLLGSNGASESRDAEIVIERHSISRTVITEDLDDRIQSIERTDVHRPGGSWTSVIAAVAATLLLGLVGFGLYIFYGNDTSPRISKAENLRQLTTKGRVGVAAISPDGQFYVYGLNTHEYKRSLWLAQVDGSKDIQLLPPDDNLVRCAAFSPDGNTIYYSLGDSDESPGGFYKIPVLGGLPVKVTESPTGGFALSPDGSRIAYHRENKDVSALVVVNLDGTEEREVTTRPIDKTFTSWTPTWSPDGSKVAIGAIVDQAKQSEEVFAVRVADGDTQQITNAELTLIQSLVWQPSGQSMIVVATDKKESLRHLWQVDLPGGAIARLSGDTDTYGSALGLSRDGRLLIAVQLRRESNLWLAPADDLSKARQISFSSINGAYGWGGVEWTNDGRIVFVAGVERNKAIFSIAPDGTDLRQITSGGFFDHRPDVSPDGRFVVFNSNRSGATEIWRVNIDGTDLRQLTNDGGNTTPVIAPDNRTIVYVSERSGRDTIWRISSDGGPPAQLTDREATDPNISPDGKFIACGYRAEDSPMRLAILNFEDGSVVKSFDMPRSTNFNGGIRWMPDGRSITIRDWANGIWKLDSSSGALTKLEGLPGEKFYGYDWSPDGKTLAFSRGREISDVALLQLVENE